MQNTHEQECKYNTKVKRNLKNFTVYCRRWEREFWRVCWDCVKHGSYHWPNGWSRRERTPGCLQGKQITRQSQIREATFPLLEAGARIFDICLIKTKFCYITLHIKFLTSTVVLYFSKCGTEKNCHNIVLVVPYCNISLFWNKFCAAIFYPLQNI